MATIMSRMTPGGGWSNEYSDDPKSWGIPFNDTKSAESYYNAQAAAEKARSLRLSNLRATTSRITSAAQTGAITKEPTMVAPSGMGGGSTWNEGGATGGYATGLVPPGTGNPRLEIPVYDQEKVEALAQRAAAPGIRKLRDQVQQVQSSNPENPNVKAMNLRQALAGYGSGLESVMGGALGAGAAQYGQEYDPQVAAAHANYEGELQAKRLASQERQAALNRSFQAWSQTGNMPGNTNPRGLPIGRA